MVGTAEFHNQYLTSSPKTLSVISIAKTAIIQWTENQNQYPAGSSTRVHANGAIPNDFLRVP